MQQQVELKIQSFLSQAIKGHELKVDDDIFELGFVNSLFALRLVTFVESEFGFQVANEDLKLDNFRTVQALSQLVLERLAIR